MSERRGFVCPDWGKNFWNPLECTIEKCAEGEYAVVDHSIQSTIFLGSKEECLDWLDDGMGD